MSLPKALLHQRKQYFSVLLSFETVKHLQNLISQQYSRRPSKVSLEIFLLTLQLQEIQFSLCQQLNALQCQNILLTQITLGKHCTAIVIYHYIKKTTGFMSQKLELHKMEDSLHPSKQMSLHTVTVGLYVYSVYFWCFDFNNPKVLTGLIFEDYNRILLCD